MDDAIDCADCDAGSVCSICLMLVSADACPTDPALLASIAADCLNNPTATSLYCEGNGECGTDDDAVSRSRVCRTRYLSGSSVDSCAFEAVAAHMLPDDSVLCVSRLTTPRC